MGRNIVNQKVITEIPEVELPGPPGKSTAAETPDNYTAQIVKLIPTEIVGVYLGIQNILSGLTQPVQAIVQGIVFLAILAIAPVYLRRVGGVTDSGQRTISLISYLIWGISLGGPFEYVLNYLKSPVTAQLIGGILVMFYTLIVPLLYTKPQTSNQ
jgi:hypothetical protein